ncbi:MAG: hypothetical protein IKK02_04490 [Tidjanibacter sp.]|nr:hypothetical protein [Tidjanibacter sp.]
MKFFSRIALVILPLLFASCIEKGGGTQYNPLLTEWTSPYGLPPFAEIAPEHFEAAMTQALAAHNEEVEAIASSAESVSYENTVVALAESGRHLSALTATLRLLAQNMGGDYMAEAKRWLPTVEAHRTRVAQQQSLFSRISALYRHRSGLDSLQQRSVENLYRSSVRSGAALEEAQRERVAAIDSLLMLHSLEYAERVTAAEGDYKMVLATSQLSGVPVAERNLSKALAVAEGYEEKWLYTTLPESAEMLLTTGQDDTLRSQLYHAYINKGITPEADNRKLAAEMVALRAERAELLGYRNYRQMVTEGRSADGRRLDRLTDSLRHAMPAILEYPMERLNKVNQRLRDTTTLLAEDMLYLQERVREEYVALTVDDVMPFLPVENVRTGAFWLANRLYGITFTPLSVDSYRNDVHSYSVADFDGRPLGTLLLDLYARPGKVAGMRTDMVIGADSLADGTCHGPVVAIAASFRRAEGQPVMLTPQQAKELFGEVGSALGIFLRRDDAPKFSRWENDYSALPELVMEQWALRPELLRNYALHYSSGIVLDNNVIRKVQRADTFDTKLHFVRQLAMINIDKELHSSADVNIADLYARNLPAEGLMPLYGEGAAMPLFADGSPYAGHLDDRLWAEVVAADIFHTFKESGDVFDRATALQLRSLLERGGEWSFSALYREFSEEGVSYLPWLVSRALADESILLPPEPEEEQVVGIDNEYRRVLSPRRGNRGERPANRVEPADRVEPAERENPTAAPRPRIIRPTERPEVEL